MQLSEDQKQAVRKWVGEGLGLSDIQKRLTADFGLSLTYLDLRFIVIDLGLQVRDKAVKPAPVPPVAAPAADDVDDEPAEPVAPFGAPAAPGPAGTVKVDIDRIQKPGSVLSGQVRFSDGVTASWFLDQFGRLGLSASKPGYKPSAQDVQAFQTELRTQMEKHGF